ncbi:MAG TPA: immunity 53 family protein, partial [Polyangiaceae bacterium]
MQQWYVEQCDGDWEHGYGVRIETLDNPGWIVAIRISETNAERLEVERTLVERTETDWLHVKTRDGSLEAACGPLNLEEALTTLRRILEDHLADPSSSTGRPAAAIAVLREGGFEERSSERERRIDRGGVTIVES